LVGEEKIWFSFPFWVITKQGSSSSPSSIAIAQAGFEVGVTAGDPKEKGIGNGREPKSIIGLPSSLRAKLAIIWGSAEFVVVDIISSFDPFNNKTQQFISWISIWIPNLFYWL